MLTGAIQLVEQGNPSNVTGVGNSANVSESKEAITPMPIGAIQQVEQGNSSNHPGRDNAGSHDHAMYAVLLKAVQSGNLKAVQDFLKLHPEATGAKVTWRNETALHIAVFAKKTHIIEELVTVMSPEDLAIRDRYGYTALARAAASEDYRMAECMIRKNPTLLSISRQNGPQGYIPVVSATNLGNEEMTRYLYSCTPLQYLELGKSCNDASLVSEALLSGYFDIALDLIERCPRLARARDRYNRSPLYALTSMPKAFPSRNRLMY
ncbi:hypothetical protein CJ030_MR1G020816 [Morella rubra]|uniref:Uncharacterized protein n=1 Tax=Morella rubra TaxID=262757 RepID=A0A6A1WK50_9ROSI|nr:hypothetical protein CJ030_MR1G020816 [Morella rubra]